MEKTIPPKLYKYQSLELGSHTLDNLRERQIWASKPKSLNDPFDCSIPYLLSEISDEDWRDGYEQLTRRFWEEKRDVAGIIRSREKYLTDGILSKKFKKDVMEINQDYIRRQLDAHKNNGVACFSGVFRSLLMWSHYADGHKGMCLEFDTRYVPFADPRKVHRVDYCSAYPSISPLSFISSPEDLAVRPLTTKSIDWEYEQEWRLITHEGDIPIVYDPRALSAIYLGCVVTNSDVKKIKAIAKHSGVRLYRMRISETEFRLEHRIYRG